MTSAVTLSVGLENEPISRIIHQTWKTHEVPKKLTGCQDTFRRFHPQWEYMLWTDEDLRTLIAEHYEWFLPYYDGYPHHIQRVDAARYFIMFHYGGVYADLDMQCMNPLDRLVETIGGVLLGHEGQVHKDGTQRVGNAILFSSPRHPFWQHVFAGLMEKYAQSDSVKIGSTFTTTGPSFLHEIYTQHPQGVTVMPVTAFYPMPWHKPEEEITLATRKQYPKAWTVHHWAGVWRSAPRQTKVQWQIGEELKEITFALPRSQKEGWGLIEQSLFQGTFYLPRLLDIWQQMIQPGDTAIVVGAYIGHHTLPLAALVGPEGHIHAFEPDNRSRELLLESLRMNRIEQQVSVYNQFPYSQVTRVYQVARWNSMKPQHMIWRAQNPNALQYASASPLSALQLNHLNLLHINACGEEYPVLQGAQQLIEQFRPILTIDIWSDTKRQASGTPLRQDQTFYLLRSLGYDYTLLESSTYLCLPQ